MTPAEHYAEAERLLAQIDQHMADKATLAGHVMSDPDAGPKMAGLMTEVRHLTPLAQLHATLATINPDRAWPQKWIISKSDPEASVDGVVVHAGGGEVRIMVRADTDHYPELGRTVTVLSRPGPISNPGPLRDVPPGAYEVEAYDGRCTPESTSLLTIPMSDSVPVEVGDLASLTEGGEHIGLHALTGKGRDLWRWRCVHDHQPRTFGPDPTCRCGHPLSMHPANMRDRARGPCLSPDPSDTCVDFDPAPLQPKGSTGESRMEGAP